MTSPLVSGGTALALICVFAIIKKEEESRSRDARVRRFLKNYHVKPSSSSSQNTQTDFAGQLGDANNDDKQVNSEKYLRSQVKEFELMLSKRSPWSMEDDEKDIWLEKWLVDDASKLIMKREAALLAVHRDICNR
jgi:hypothetical protein